MKFSKLVEHVSKKPIPPHTKHLLVEVMLMDEEMEDVEVCIIEIYPGIVTDGILQVPFILIKI
jgi:ubiquitin-activating enzyme E1